MISIIGHWIAAALALIIAAYLVPGVHITIFGALIAAAVLALVNLFIKPILYILTLPINIITLGLFSFVINAILVYYVAQIVSDFRIDNFVTALIFTLVLSILNVFFGVKN